MLMDGIAEFAHDNRAMILEGQTGKTRRFASGSISWRESTERIDVLKLKAKEKKRPVADYLTDGIVGFARALAKLLEHSLLGVQVGRLVRVKWEWKKTALLQLFKDGEISPKQLRSCGLVYVGKVDELYVETTRDFASTESDV